MLRRLFEVNSEVPEQYGELFDRVLLWWGNQSCRRGVQFSLA